MQMEMSSSWKRMPPDVAREVLERLKWERQASGVFRRVCKGWRDTHDQCVRHLSVSAHLSVNTHQFDSALMMSRFLLRFRRVNEMDVRGDRFCLPGMAEEEGSDADKWLRALFSLTALTTLNLGFCKQLSDDGLRSLSSLTALANLNLEYCVQVSDDGLRALGSLTALTSLNLLGCCQVSDDGLQALAGLTALANLNLTDCSRVSSDGLRTLAGLTALTDLNLCGCQEVSDDG